MGLFWFVSCGCGVYCGDWCLLLVDLLVVYCVIVVACGLVFGLVGLVCCVIVGLICCLFLFWF